MLSDPEVQAYIRTPHKCHVETWSILYNWVGMGTLRGLPQWAVERRDTNQFIGRVGLWNPSEFPEVEFGFEFIRAAQGRGYAGEAGKAVINYCFQDLHLESLIAYTVPANEAAITALARVGFRSRGIVAAPHSDGPLMILQLIRDDVLSADALSRRWDGLPIGVPALRRNLSAYARGALRVLGRRMAKL